MLKASFVLLASVVTIGSVNAPIESSSTAATAAATNCGDLRTLCGGHNMLLGPSGSTQDPHSDCRICIDQGGCHSGCNAASAEQREDYTRLVAAAEAGDIADLIRAAESAPDYAYYNSDRSAVQVLSCNGTSVIASVPLDGASRQIAAVQLRQYGTAVVAASNE